MTQRQLFSYQNTAWNYRYLLKLKLLWVALSLLPRNFDPSRGKRRLKIWNQQRIILARFLLFSQAVLKSAFIWDQDMIGSWCVVNPVSSCHGLYSGESFLLICVCLLLIYSGFDSENAWTTIMVCFSFWTSQIQMLPEQNDKKKIIFDRSDGILLRVAGISFIHQFFFICILPVRML